jgi:hypothetical protein
MRATEWQDVPEPQPAMKPFLSLVLLLAIPVCILAADPANEPSPPSASKAKAQTRAAVPKPSGGQEKWVGIAVGPIPQMVRAHLRNVPENQGLMVFNISKESPAVVAGMERFDIILRADGQPVNTSQELQQVVSRRNFGTQLRLDLIQKGQPKTAYCIVLEKPEGEPESPGGHNPFGMLKPENVSIQFAFTDGDGKRQLLSAKTLAEFGQKAQQDEEFRNRVQQMFQSLPQNRQGITIMLRPTDGQPAVPAP